jgi:hypothetical protein
MQARFLWALLFLPVMVHAQVFQNQGNIVSVTGDAEIKVIPTRF